MERRHELRICATSLPSPRRAASRSRRRGGCIRRSPSLSRRIRDLELEVGAQLLIRSPRGIELTAAGRAFLDHARLASSQVDAAGEAARRAVHSAKTSFVIGFLTGIEMEWLPEAVRILYDVLASNSL